MLQAGDEMMSVNGLSFRGKSLSEVVAIIRDLIGGSGDGEKPSTITLQFGRDKKPARRNDVSELLSLSANVPCILHLLYVCMCVCILIPIKQNRIYLKF